MSRQRQILAWAKQTFGPTAGNADERAARLVEEAIECGQAAGLGKDVVARILERVYSRPVGELGREIGGTGMTLEAFAEVAGYSVNDEVDREFARVLGIDREAFRMKHHDKVMDGIADLIAAG